MKKVIFLAIAAAAALTACSKSEVVDSTVLNQVIAFDNYVGKDAQTKASIVTGVTSVNVNAWLHPVTLKEGDTFTANFMENLSVNKEGEQWVYSPLKYWPAKDQAIDFVAWVPEPKNTQVKDAELTFTVPQVVKDQTDLIVAAGVPAQNGGTVNLVFKHLLSRIGFVINAEGIPTGDNVSTKVTLNEVTLNGDFASTGTVDMTNSEQPFVEGTASTTAYTLKGENFGYTENLIVNSQTGGTPNTDDSYIMLIPHNNVPNNITVSYTITTYKETKNDDGSVTVTDEVVGEPITNITEFPLQPTTEGSEAFKFEAGKAYKYIFNIKMDSISFSVDVEEWDETPEDVTINPATPAA